MGTSRICCPLMARPASKPLEGRSGDPRPTGILRQKPWEIVVEPNAEKERLDVVTDYEVWDVKRPTSVSGHTP